MMFAVYSSSDIEAGMALPLTPQGSVSFFLSLVIRPNSGDWRLAGAKVVTRVCCLGIFVCLALLDFCGKPCHHASASLKTNHCWITIHDNRWSGQEACLLAVLSSSGMTDHEGARCSHARTIVVTFGPPILRKGEISNCYVCFSCGVGAV